MIVEKEIPICEFLYAISEIVDLAVPLLNNHHKKVCYISYRIAQEMQLTEQEIHDILLASLLHDIGTFSTGERLNSLVFKPAEAELNEHSLVGYKLLKDFPLLYRAARIIKHHHSDYHQMQCIVPIGSHIINLADRICILFDESREILSQVSGVLDKIYQTDYKFYPHALSAVYNLAKSEYFWIEAFTPSINAIILKNALCPKKIMGLDIIRSFAKLISHISDFRSRYTVTHSSGVAAITMELASIFGFSENECRLAEIAGFLHDLGKLAVPNDILDKPGKLDAEEYNIIRKHSYYTYNALNKISGLEDIAVWAAFHHERQDGSGYPFHVKDKALTLPARIIAVADIFTALSEDRPYRPAMNAEKIKKTLNEMVINGAIDKNIVEQINANIQRLNSVYSRAHQEAINEYTNFCEKDL